MGTALAIREEIPNALLATSEGLERVSIGKRTLPVLTKIADAPITQRAKTPKAVK